MAALASQERITELRQVLNEAAQAIWDIHGITQLLLSSGEMDAASFSPEVRAVVSMVHERAIHMGKGIEEVL